MNVSFRTLQSKADKSALIDSGATNNFIDGETWKRLGIGRKELARPVTVHNVDGTENRQGKITHYCCVKPAAGLCAHLTEEEGVRSEACRDMRSDS
jgi:hypothetical protein